MITFEVRSRTESGTVLPVVLWRLEDPMMVASTVAVGGGVGPRGWIMNAQVPSDYARRDCEHHVEEIANALGVDGPGVGMLTAFDVTRICQAEDEGLSVAATVGLALPTWAAAPDEPVAATAGTINIVAFVPEPLTDAALLNCLCTATEAKTQALFGAGVDGTGTASDAVAVACPTSGEFRAFGGPRSVWGARLARAIYDAVSAGCSTLSEKGGT